VETLYKAIKTIAGEWDRTRSDAQATTRAFGGPPGSMSDMMARQLFLEARQVDWSKLPKWQKVEKYLGVGAGWMVGTEDGLWLEGYELKAPAPSASE
ncbi:MAG: hypothetical protein ACOC93_05315, partial [Planctomycetota bacterium]